MRGAFGGLEVAAIFVADELQPQLRALRRLAIKLHPDKAQQARRADAQLSACTQLSACRNALGDLWAAEPDYARSLHAAAWF